MKRELNAKNLIFSVTLGLASALAVYVFFKIFSSYNYPTFFYHPVKEEEKALAKYIGKAGFLPILPILHSGFPGFGAWDERYVIYRGLKRGLNFSITNTSLYSLPLTKS